MHVAFHFLQRHNNNGSLLKSFAGVTSRPVTLRPDATGHTQYLQAGIFGFIKGNMAIIVRNAHQSQWYDGGAVHDALPYQPTNGL